MFLIDTSVFVWVIIKFGYTDSNVRDVIETMTRTKTNRSNFQYSQLFTAQMYKQVSSLTCHLLFEMRKCSIPSCCEH